MIRWRSTALRRWFLCGAVISSVLAGSTPGWAMEGPFDLATLQGLAALTVLIEQVQPDVERAGLTRGNLEAEVTAHLRQAGIPVTPSAPAFLYVNVNAVRNAAGLYAVNVSVQLEQPVFLARNPRLVHIGATTWSSAAVALSEADRLAAVRGLVAGIVDQFIAAYRLENPQRQAAATE